MTHVCVTPYEIIFDRFIKKLKDPKFLLYENLSNEEIERLIQDNCLNLMEQAIDEILINCSPDVNFYDKDDMKKQFDFKIVDVEIGLITDLMRQKYFEQDEIKLKAFENHFSTQEINTFSPAPERKTFEDMLKGMKEENIRKIKNYASKDRVTGKYKTIKYGLI